MDFLKSMYAKLSGMNIAHLLVLALVVKAIVSDVSYASFLLTVPVLAYDAYKLYLASLKPKQANIDAEVKKELDGMKSKLNALTMERGAKPSATTRYF